MDTALTFILLLRCWCVWSLSRGQSVSFSVVFSDGTQLLVDVNEEHPHPHHHHHHRPHHQNKRTGSAPSVQVLTSVPSSGSPHLLVCLLSGLTSPVQDVLWWVNDTLVTSSEAKVSWMRSDGGGAYSATSVWEVSAAEWRSRSSYWCGMIQEGQVYRQRVCSEDGL